MATYIILSNSQMVEVPEDANPDAFRRWQEAKLRIAASPKPKKKSSRTPSRHCSKRVNYAERVVSSVTLQADERALAVARRMDELKA